jgi:DNA modification methylase
VWEGGDPDCDHSADEEWIHRRYLQSSGLAGNGPSKTQHDAALVQWRKVHGNTCPRCGATRVDQQLGLESTPDLFVASMVAVFREVRRVLRRDGTCWVNLGDSYVSGQGGRQSAVGELPPTSRFDRPDPKPRPDLPNPPAGWAERAVTRRTYPGADSGLKPKDLCGIPWRVAFALQADGWYLRSDIVWSKPNPMPESVTDRPTKAHEYVFLLTRSPRYFFDADAVREAAPPWNSAKGFSGNGKRAAATGYDMSSNQFRDRPEHDREGTGRNIRSVWEIATQPYPEAHFATFPEELPRRCILAGTSERGCCPECGAPWERMVEREREYDHTTTQASHADSPYAAQDAGGIRNGVYVRTKTTGWRQSCGCTDLGGFVVHPSVPCTVLDPFMGSGTTALVARRLGRRSIGVELNPDYAALCSRRLQQLSLFAEPTT